MAFFNKVSQSANAAKWKINQQKQIFQLQSKLSEINRSISTFKMKLGEQAYQSFIHKGSIIDELEPVCQNISSQYGLLEQTQQELDFIKSQIPPVSEDDFLEQPTVVEGQLVCPNCGRPIQARFCTTCGMEGVPFRGNE